MLDGFQVPRGTVARDRRGKRRHLLLLGALLILSLVLVAAAVPISRSNATTVSDPGQAGPYAVGVTQRTLERTSNRNGQPRTLETTIWYPATRGASAGNASPDRSGGPYPVVVFSHGLNGSPTGSRFFTEHLASHGFVVVAPAHPGNTETDCPRPCVRSNPAWLEALQETMANRPYDLGFAFDQMVALAAGPDPQLGGMVDARRAELAGWSLGGWTTLATLATSSRFLAGVTFAPSSYTDYTINTAAVRQPNMIIVGQEDNLFRRGEQYFAELPSRQEHRLVIIERAGHVVFGDECDSNTPSDCPPDRLAQPEAHARINHWATAFLGAYVARNAAYERYLDPSISADDPELEIRVRSQ